MNKKMKHLAFLVPLLILLGMTVTPLMTIFYGKEIQLATEPVDPRDLFRGDYVTLRYMAESVSPAIVDEEVFDHFKQFEDSTMLSPSINVYSVLEKTENGTYDVVKVVMKKPSSGLYLKGKIEYQWYATERIDINYNLDKYFVPENTGKELEDAIQTTSEDDDELTNVVSVIKVRNGHAILIDVQVNE